MSKYRARSGIWCFFLCVLVYAFTVYSGNELRRYINIPHIVIPTLPIYIVLGVVGVFIMFIFVREHRIKVDVICALLAIRLLLHIIPVFYTNVSQNFMINYVTSGLCIIFFIIGRNFAFDSDFIERIINVILLIICIQTIFESFLGTQSYWGSTYFYKRDLTIPIGASNAIASKIIPCYGLVMCNKSNKIIRILNTNLVVLSLALTKSRSGIIAFLVILGIVLVWNGQLSIKNVLAITVVLTVIGVLFYRFATKTLLGGFVFSESDSTILGRYESWENGLSIFSDHPIFGSGFSKDVITNNPHNYIIDILMRSGIVGIFLFITIVIQFIKKIKNTTFDPFVRGCICFATCMLIQGLAEVVLFSYVTDMLLWFILGAMVCRANTLKYGYQYNSSN